MASDSLKTKKNNMNQTKTYLAAVFFVFVSVFNATGILAEELSLYYSNDMYGKVEPCG